MFVSLSTTLSLTILITRWFIDGRLQLKTKATKSDLLETSEWKNVLHSFLHIPSSSIVGSGYNACCNDLWWLETAVDYNKVHKDVPWLIYLYLGKHEIFSAFHVKKQVSPTAERISCWNI